MLATAFHYTRSDSRYSKRIMMREHEQAKISEIHDERTNAMEFNQIEFLSLFNLRPEPQVEHIDKSSMDIAIKSYSTHNEFESDVNVDDKHRLLNRFDSIINRIQNDPDICNDSTDVNQNNLNMDNMQPQTKLSEFHNNIINSYIIVQTHLVHKHIRHLLLFICFLFTRNDRNLCNTTT